MAILVTAGLVLSELHTWQQNTTSTPLAVSASVVGFIFTYVLIYIAHEWGHWIGARLTRSDMPFAPYRSPLIGYFDTGKHSSAQFLSLSWGGVFAYLGASASTAFIFFGTPSPLTAGMVVAGLAFTVQSLAVDLPQIIKVHRHADPQTTNQAGTMPNLILKRTWQTWLPLAAILLIWNLAL